MRNLSLFLLLFVAVSCVDEKQFSDVPFLRYEGLSWEKIQVDGFGEVDRLRIKLYMTDGDGDVGLEDDQTSPPFDADSPYHYNLWIRYLEKQADSLVEIQSAEFSARLPNLTPDGQNKTLEAVVEYDIDLTQSAADSVQFYFTLVDRSLQLSNEVSTGVIYAKPE
jgi:hypothetical protein